MLMSMCVDGASFAGAPRLQSLCLQWDDIMVLQNGCLQQLTAVTSLSLVGCGLRSIPADVAALSATLCVLDLSRNDNLQLDNAGVATILCCSRLKTFALYKPGISEWEDRLGLSWRRIEQHILREGYIPVQFSEQSLTNLLRLSSLFRAQHSRELDICLSFEDYDTKIVSNKSEH